ncbi:autotransporter outer membrane beta-barrel domain-containing protein [Oricola sp.]|uniref:autotransporter outer membrane beta-barrel domain-containing protein n=1 Tax=Oricola sp. TaxID=1979950 RepID=UPI0025FE30A1|nr:autotransporter outer membrane beta-barrel domain-containing protein [Oricola sp.]MCI5074180.1 autotransporter domain-containing protein [Oricola sp.]
MKNDACEALVVPGEVGASRRSRGKHARLLSGTAIGLFFMGFGGPATADTPCTINGVTQTCTDDQSGGIAVTDPIEVLNVHSLDGSIFPSPGTSGISFQSTGPVSIVSDTGNKSIFVFGADGIHAETSGDTLSIDHEGKIISFGGIGVSAVSLGDVDVDVDGDILASTGIYARNDVAGSTLSVTHDGKIWAFDGAGIDVASSSTPIYIDNSGNILSVGDGISAVNTSGFGIEVEQYGDIIAGGRGVFADSSVGSVSVMGVGDIHADGNGVEALSSSMNVSVDYHGDITSLNGYGIMADAPDGSASATGSGDISAYSGGIFVQATGLTGSATVDWDGDISTATGRGVYAYAARGVVSVTTDGDIVAPNDGIFAYGDGEASVTVNHAGDIDAGNRGIYAYSPRGEVSVTVSSGDITALAYGIHAFNESDANGVTVDFTGNILQSVHGIHAESPRGEIDVTVRGDITASSDGIFAQNFGEASVRVDQSGALDAGERGIFAYSSEGAITVIADGTIDSGREGIFAQNYGAGAIDIDNWADIDAGTKGIFASTTRGQITIDNVARIDSAADGIFAINDGTASVSVTSTGDIDAGYKGIYAYSSRGSVMVDSDGDITSTNDGIYAQNDSNSSGVGVTVYSDGMIDAGNTGIYARSTRGSVLVDNDGDVYANFHGIFAENDSTSGDAGVSITTMGDIDVGSMGIYGRSTRGAVTIWNDGDVTSGNHGIFAENNSNTSTYGISITSFGDIDASGMGIYGYSPRGAVTIASEGDIDSGQDGIFAQNDSSSGDYGVSVTSVGHIDSGGMGIYGQSTRGGVYIDSEGDIDATKAGIFALNDASTNEAGITIVNVGDIDAGTKGIYGQSTRGFVSIDSQGDIDSVSDGLFAENDSDDGATGVSIVSVGDIDAGGMGAYAYSTYGAASIESEGDIDAEGSGLVAINSGDLNDLPGSKVTVTHTGDIDSETGSGIVGQSDVSEVSVTLNSGALTAAADGISVHSENDLSVMIGEDASVTGAAGFAGVLFSQGFENSLVNYGTISNAGGLTEDAVLADGNDIDVDNYGTITGRVTLGPWSNSFNNHAGGLFEMGDLVNLTSGNMLTNSGVVSPGGQGLVQTTDLTGGLVNNADGTLLFDVDMDGSQTDVVNVTDEASLDGDLALSFVSANATPDSYTIITTGGGVTLQSLDLVNPMVLGDISYVNGGNDVELSITGFDFSPTGIVGNAAALGDYIGASFEAGSDGLDPIVLALLNLPTLEEADDALSQLSPTMYLSDQIAAMNDAEAFADSMLSCRMASGNYKFGSEGQCVWGRGVYRDSDRSSGNGSAGFASQSFDLAGGVQVALKDTDWRLGGALGVRLSDRSGENGASSEGTSVMGGGVLKYAPGPYLLAGAVSFSYGEYDTERSVSFPGFSDMLTGTADVTTVNARLRSAYTMQSGDFYLRPQADLNATYVHTAAFTETGGVASISTDATSNTVFSLVPSIEIGGQTTIGEGLLVRPYLRGGVGLYMNNDFELNGIFSADTAGVDPFTIGVGTDDILWTVAAGVDFLRTEGGVVQLFYEGSFGDHTTIHSGGAKLSMDF